MVTESTTSGEVLMKTTTFKAPAAVQANVDSILS